MKEDSDLVKEYLEGNESSLKELVDRHVKSVYSFIYRLTGLEGEVPDITQEVFIKIWKNLKKYDSNQSFRAWIMTIARNTAIDWMRKRRVAVFSDFNRVDFGEYFEDTLSDPSPIADELFEKNELKEALEKEVSRLPINYREVIILRHSEDLSFEEIGSVVKKPVNTVKSQYRRALLKMKDSIDNAPKQAL